MEEKDDKGRFSGLVGKTEKPKPTGSTVAALVCSLIAAATCWLPLLLNSLVLLPIAFGISSFIIKKSDCDMRMWAKIIDVIALSAAAVCFFATFSCMTPAAKEETDKISNGLSTAACRAFFMRRGGVDAQSNAV